MKTKFALFLSLIALNTFAGQDRGGGTYVLKDGEYVISDRYYESVESVELTPVKQVTFNQLPEAVKRATRSVMDFMEKKLGISTPDIHWSAQYFLVPKGRENHGMCNNYIPTLTHRSEAQVRYGCTNGNVTFLYVDVLELADLRQQAYAILHERLWTRQNATQQDVVDIVDGVMTLEEARDYQLENPDKPVDPSVFKKMDALYKAAKKLGLGLAEFTNFTRTPEGGWINPKCLDPESRNYVVGLTSKVTCDSVWGPDYPKDGGWHQINKLPIVEKQRKIKLINSKIFASDVSNLGLVEDTKIIESNVRAKVLFAYFLDNNVGEQGPVYDGVCIETCIQIRWPEIKKTSIQKSNIFGNLVSNGANIISSNLTVRSTITLESGVELKASQVGIERSEYWSPLSITVEKEAKLNKFNFFGVMPDARYEEDRKYGRKDNTWDPYRPRFKVLSGTHIDGVSYTSRFQAGKLFDKAQILEFGDVARVNKKNRVIDRDATGSEFAYRASSEYFIKRSEDFYQ